MLAGHRVCHHVAATLCIWEPVFSTAFWINKPLSVGNCGHSVKPTVSVLTSGNGEWKGMELDADVSLSISFGCHYYSFSSASPLTVHWSWWPSAHAVHQHSMCCLWMWQNLMSFLHGKPKLFLPEILFLPSPIVLGSWAGAKYFWYDLITYYTCAHFSTFTKTVAMVMFVWLEEFLIQMEQ